MYSNVLLCVTVLYNSTAHKTVIFSLPVSLSSCQLCSNLHWTTKHWHWIFTYTNGKFSSGTNLAFHHLLPLNFRSLQLQDATSPDNFAQLRFHRRVKLPEDLTRRLWLGIESNRHWAVRECATDVEVSLPNSPLHKGYIMKRCLVDWASASLLSRQTANTKGIKNVLAISDNMFFYIFWGI